MNRKQLQRTLETAIEHQRGGRHAEAERLYAQTRKSAPNVFDPWYLSGTLALHDGRLEDAVTFLTKALRLDGSAANAKLFLGMALADLKRYAEAEKPLRAALQKIPGYPDAWENLATTLRELGQPAEAAACLRKALELRADRGETHLALGTIVAMLDGVVAAEPHFRRATELAPDAAVAWSNLGQALVEQTGRLAEAESCFGHAITLDPFLVEAMNGRALARLRAYRAEQAKREYDDVIGFAPRNRVALSARAMLMNYLTGRSRSEEYAAHQAFATALDAPVGVPAPVAVGAHDGRIRVGFVSPDLRAHAVACFIEPLLQHLDRSRFQILLYHDHRTVDVVSERLKANADGWRNLVGLSDEAAERVIRADALDIAVDLAGHSALNRLALFARRLAPVQVTYLGYPNTTGLRAMDYRFVDAHTDPVGEADEYHSEKLMRFADTAWAYLPPCDDAEIPALARPAGGPFTFGCFNHFLKVSDDQLRVWAKVLQAVPGSRLILKSRGLQEPGIAEGIRRRLAGVGLEETRVELRDHAATLQEHLAMYREIDVALDSFPYAGTTTTCEALWMGVPVVTRAGDRHVSRVGVSLLHAVGHPELIGADEAEYVRIATELARDSGRLAQLRAGLREDLRRSPVLDHAAQARRFGSALETCWAAHLAANPVPASSAA
jgi:predicted O-linked N-acetylglucosamine transferase (SPINDLY family)